MNEGPRIPDIGGFLAFARSPVSWLLLHDRSCWHVIGESGHKRSLQDTTGWLFDGV